jgi:L-asparaginase/Glu-tRNA(Gln) amidotransferase subunit D
VAIDIEQLRILPPASAQEIAAIKNRFEVQSHAFVLEPDYLAVLAFGGTIQSAYIPSDETIKPVSINPVLDRVIELAEKFGIIGRSVTGSILISKDSRAVTNADVANLIYTVQQIPNRKVIVSCGTYMLPIIAQVLDIHFGASKSDKIIGVTGSWLPQSVQGQDVDFNAGATVAAVNAFNMAKQSGIVFAQFHGEIVSGDDLTKLTLHPPGIQPRLARPFVLTA